jgi:hypothetical protein
LAEPGLLVGFCFLARLARWLSIVGFWLLVPRSNVSQAPETSNEKTQHLGANLYCRSVITGFYFFSKISKQLYPTKPYYYDYNPFEKI